MVFIPKSGKKSYSDPRAYRPISLMCFLYKTMEKVLPDIEKIIVPDKDSGNMLNLLNLNTGKTAGGKK